MPKNLKELRQARADKATQGKLAQDQFNALGAKAERSAEEDTQMTALGAQLDAFEADVSAIDAEIAAEEANVRRAALFGGTSGPAMSAGRTVNEPNPEATGGFKSVAEFAHAVRLATTGQFDRRLVLAPEDGTGAVATGFHQNQGSSGEGFLVPAEYSKSVWEIAFSDVDLLGMAAPEPTSSNAVIKPKDETTPWGATGVQAYWGIEGGQLTGSKAALTGELMNLHKLYAFVTATDELLSDAPMLQDRLTRKAGQAISWKASDAIAWGDGVGKPLGFMKAPSLITVSKESGQAADTIVLANLAKMVARVLRAGGKPIWLANTDILPQLVTMTVGNVPVYLPNNQPGQASPWDGYLMGYPLMFSEHSDTLGNKGDLVCANMSGYYAATKAAAGVEFAQSMHLFFDQGLQAFRWTFRLAGQPILSKAVNPARGSATKSHFVALEDR